MEELNIRQKELIEFLYESTAPLTRDFISRELEVSTRTVLNEIKNSNEILKCKGITIITERGRGYRLKFENETAKNYLDHLLEVESTSLNISESAIRVKDITRILIERNTYITIQEIADILYVSKQTISNDIKAVKILLNQFHLNIASRAGYGLYIEGDERGKRKCYCFCLPFNLNDENIFEINSKEISFFKNLSLDKIFKIVTDSLVHADWDMMDGTEKILTMHIAVSIMRIKKQVALEIVSVDIVEYEREYKFVKMLLSLIENEMDISFSEAECEYILTYFISCSRNKSISEATTYRVKQMLQFIWENYHFDFRKDTDLERDLLIHMSAYEKRSQYKIWAKNPILEDIKEKYVLYFEIAISAIKHVYHENYDIDEGEAGFIALHLVSSNTNLKNSTKKIDIAIVCAAGRVSGKLIEKMLLKEFGDAVYVSNVVSYAEYKKLSKLECDLVLSNMALEKKGSPIYRIKGIPEREELYAILQSYKLNNQQRSEAFHTLFQKDLFFPSISFESKDEALHFMCTELYDKGYVSENFEYQILERENISSTIMGKGIAMPHPLVNESLKTGIAIATLKKELTWDDKKVNLIFVINVKDDDIKNLTFFYDQILNIIKDYRLRDQLIKCIDFDDFYHVFSTL